MPSDKSSSTHFSVLLRKLLIGFVTLLITLFLPVVAAVILVFALTRAIVSLVGRWFRPELISILHGSDAIFAPESVYTHTEANTTIVLQLICKGDLSVEELRVVFQKHVLNHRDQVTGRTTYRKLHQRWTTFLGYYFWTRDESFDLSHHIRLYDYNKDDDPELALPSACTEADLVRVTGKLAGWAYKKDTSPWEILMIPNYMLSEEVEGLVLCLRIHHSLADGYSVVGLIHRLFDTPAPPPMAKFPTNLSLVQRTWRNLTVMSLLPYDLATILVDTFLLLPATDLHPWVPPQKSGSGDGVFTFCSGTRDWKDVKNLMRKYGVNSNAAIYSVTVGAALRLIEEGGQGLPTGWITSLVPTPLANHPGGLVNHASVTSFAVKPRVHSGAQLIRQVGQQIRPAYALDRVAVMNNWGIRIVGYVYPAMIWQLIKTMIKSLRITFALTNVPGPVRELKMRGIYLRDIEMSVGSPSGSPTVGVAAMISYVGKVRILLHVDRSIFEGCRLPRGFAKHVEDEISRLTEAEDATD